jgi:hypothetical protein
VIKKGCVIYARVEILTSPGLSMLNEWCKHSLYNRLFSAAFTLKYADLLISINIAHLQVGICHIVFSSTLWHIAQPHQSL